MDRALSSVVIIPTTGNPLLTRAVRSVLAQTSPTTCYVVCDGPGFESAVRQQLRGLPAHLCVLPQNTGARNDRSGHRIYAAFSHLVEEDQVMFLDEDNTLRADHVQRCTALMAERELDWCYTLRNICEPDGRHICRDDCESLGRWPTYLGSNLVDTGCFFVKRQNLVQVCQVWHGDYFADRRFLNALVQHFPRFDCVGHYTLNYTLSNRERGAGRAFFEEGNAQMRARHGEHLPWRAADCGPEFPDGT